MPENTVKMLCPACGVEMNHHADKLIEPRTAEESRTIELVIEVHSCPQCGKGAARLRA
jgi:ribosomal protein S27AE